MTHPGPMSMAELLEQREVWYAREEGELVCVRLDDMDARHLANLRGWLVRNADKMHSAALGSLWSIGSFLQGEQALIDLDFCIAGMAEADPVTWIEEQPLLVAITKRLATLLEQTHGN